MGWGGGAGIKTSYLKAYTETDTSLSYSRAYHAYTRHMHHSSDGSRATVGLFVFISKSVLTCRF